MKDTITQEEQRRRMATQQMIEVLQAYQQGKKIQYRPRHSQAEWEDLNHTPLWAFHTNEYRVQPEPREFWICYDREGDELTPLVNASVYGIEQIPDRKMIRVREVL